MFTDEVVYNGEIIIDKRIEDLINDYDGGLRETDLARHIIGDNYEPAYADDDLKDYFGMHGVFISTMYDDLKILNEPETSEYFLSLGAMYLFNYMLLEHDEYIERTFGIKPINKSLDEVTDDDIDETNMARVVIYNNTVYTTNDFEYLWINITQATIHGKESYYDCTNFGWDSECGIDPDELFREVSDLIDVDRFICGDPCADDDTILEYEYPVEVNMNVDELPVIYTNKNIDWIKVKYPNGEIEYYDLIFN